MGIILKYAIKVGLTWVLISSIGKCSIDDVVDRSANILKDNNPHVYQTIDGLINAGEGLYELFIKNATEDEYSRDSSEY